MSAFRPKFAAGLWLAGLFLLAGAGCGRRADEGLLPVAGVVTVEGQPLARGRVLFRPDAARGNASLHHPLGAIGPDGRYHLVTAGAPGAPPGWYKVLVFAAEPSGHPSGASPGVPKWLTDPRYTRLETTDLAVEVVEQPPPRAFHFDLRGSDSGTP